jgi:hypothetical protein
VGRRSPRELIREGVSGQPAAFVSRSSVPLSGITRLRRAAARAARVAELKAERLMRVNRERRACAVAALRNLERVAGRSQERERRSFAQQATAAGVTPVSIP